MFKNYNKLILIILVLMKNKISYDYIAYRLSIQYNLRMAYQSRWLDQKLKMAGLKRIAFLP